MISILRIFSGPWANWFYIFSYIIFIKIQWDSYYCFYFTNKWKLRHKVILRKDTQIVNGGIINLFLMYLTPKPIFWTTITKNFRRQIPHYSFHWLSFSCAQELIYCSYLVFLLGFSLRNLHCLNLWGLIEFPCYSKVKQRK